jgi:hypothetical protein
LIWAALETVDVERGAYLQPRHLEEKTSSRILEIAEDQGRRLLDNIIWEFKPTTLTLPSKDKFHNVTRRCKKEEGLQETLVNYIVNYCKAEAP